jgi:hypothetical protein
VQSRDGGRERQFVGASDAERAARREGSGTEEIVSKHADVFRTRLGVDPAVDDKPVQILPEEGVPPHRAKVRRCRPPQLAFLADKGKELERLGVAEQNMNSRWASAPHSVPTSNAEGDRLTVDLRQVHQRTEPMDWPASDLELVLAPSCSLSLLR